MLLAILLPVIIGMIGMAVDMGNVYVTHTRLQAATDAAALAGSLELPSDPDLNKGLVVAAATNMLTENLPGAVIESVSPGAETRSVEVAAKAQAQLMLMGVLGLADPWVRASAAAGFNNLEVVFVLDNTGSMKGGPIAAVRAATEDLVELILPAGKTVASKIGLVGFRGRITSYNVCYTKLLRPSRTRNWLLMFSLRKTVPSVWGMVRPLRKVDASNWPLKA